MARWLEPTVDGHRAHVGQRRALGSRYGTHLGCECGWETMAPLPPNAGGELEVREAYDEHLRTMSAAFDELLTYADVGTKIVGMIRSTRDLGHARPSHARYYMHSTTPDVALDFTTWAAGTKGWEDARTRLYDYVDRMEVSHA